LKYSRVQLVSKIEKRITLGKVQRKISLYDLKQNNYNELDRPIFVLSTGRSRTHWLTNILAEHKNVLVRHQPEIPFLQQGRIIYDNFSKNECFHLLEQLVCTARDHVWLDCVKRNLRYIETNNRITFALPILKKLIPTSIFLHITRNPIDFIRSGRNRKWYQGDGHDLGRITYPDKSIWEELSVTQKIAWLWLETNKFIIQHSDDLRSERYLCVASEKLDEVEMSNVFEFLKLPSIKITKKWYKTATNIQENNLNIVRNDIKKELKDCFFYADLKEMADRFQYSI